MENIGFLPTRAGGFLDPSFPWRMRQFFQVVSTSVSANEPTLHLVILTVFLQFRNSKDYPQAQKFKRRTHRTQRSSYTQGYGLLHQKVQIKTSRGKASVRQGRGETRQELPPVLSRKGRGRHLILPAVMCDNTHGVLPTGTFS